jgi:hypothetical protein
VIELRGGFRGVKDRDEVDVISNNEIRIGGTIVVDAYRENGKIGLFMVEGEERRHLLDARHAPACPEIEQDNLAAVAGKMNGGRAVGDGEVGRGFAGLRGMRTAITRGQKS